MSVVSIISSYSRQEKLMRVIPKIIKSTLLGQEESKRLGTSALGSFLTPVENDE